MSSLTPTTMCTVSGRLVDLAAPDPASIHLPDIAHALGMLCRYGGHTRQHYSVAEHSLWVALALSGPAAGTPPLLRLHGLLHDAHEAYCGDLISPVKRYQALTGNPCHRDNLESHLDVTIYRALGCDWGGLTPDDFKAIRAADLAVGAAECVAFGIPVTPGREQEAWDWRAAGVKSFPSHQPTRAAAEGWLRAVEDELAKLGIKSNHRDTEARRPTE